MWTIGKVILRFFTDTSIRIRFDNQQSINRIIDEHVGSREIKALIKRLLVWNHDERISFEQYLLD